MDLIVGRYFGKDDKVEVDGRAFEDCTFDDCEILGEGNEVYMTSCRLQGRAADFFMARLEPHRLMTVHLDGKGVEFGPAAANDPSAPINNR